MSQALLRRLPSSLMRAAGRQPLSQDYHGWPQFLGGSSCLSRRLSFHQRAAVHHQRIANRQAPSAAVGFERAPALRQLLAAIGELYRFSPHRLQLEYLAGADPVGPLFPRRYTLTHSDITGRLWLSIGPDYNHCQVLGWHIRLLRDEVLAEWQAAAPELEWGSPVRGVAGESHRGATAMPAAHAMPSLHIFCHINACGEAARSSFTGVTAASKSSSRCGGAGREAAPLLARLPAAAAAAGGSLLSSWLPWPPIPPTLRAMVFQKDMPLALTALAYAERQLLEDRPVLRSAPIYFHLRSHLPELDRGMHWGVLGDPSTWGPCAMVS